MGWKNGGLEFGHLGCRKSTPDLGVRFWPLVRCTLAGCGCGNVRRLRDGRWDVGCRFCEVMFGAVWGWNF